MCTFKTAAMFCICRATKGRDIRISTNLRKLESVNNDTWSSSLEKKVVHETAAKEVSEDKNIK